MRIASLHTYPVKGCHRIDHDVAQVEPWGLAGDRRWAMVDADGVAITQRESPVLTQLRVTHRPGGLVLAAPGRPELTVDEPADGPKEFVRVFRSHLPTPARIAESEWSSAFLGRPARLVWQADAGSRAIGGVDEVGDPVSFADGWPMLLATEASLEALNGWLPEAVPMTRFRPNIVVAGAAPWAEDEWSARSAKLQIGDVVFRAGPGCPRCVVTTVDQETGEKGKEPLHTLGKYRRVGSGLLFAINMAPLSRGSLRVGDEIRLIE
ncbi:MAG TPA: MOSC N-terminal beta barrel domain-containing protein [Actinoplanes sp.]|nr:MOSC N-terminal beta barrel domain-containing protein [Actinoplanes sp.]